MKFLISNLKLLATRFRAVTLINILGLSMAFAVAAVVAIQAHYDLTYDRGYEHSGEIFYGETIFDEYPEWGNWNFNQAIPVLLKDNVPEIKAYCLTNRSGETSVRLDDAQDAPKFTVTAQSATPGFLEVFTPQIISGDASRTLIEPGHILISEKTAIQLFGAADPVGQTIFTEGGGSLIIDAVYGDFPKNSSMINGLLTYMQPERPNNWGFLGYFMFDPDDHGRVVEKINNLGLPENHESQYGGQTFYMTNLSRCHIYGGEMGENHIDATIYMLVMGVVIMVVAFINFINLFMSMAPTRVRKINTFRILGIGRVSLRSSLAAESALVLLVSMALGLFFVEWFSSSVFTEFFSADISPEANIPLLAVLALALMSAAFLMGLYPARYATSFDVAVALKSSMALTPRGVRLRNALIVLQFAIAIFFICFSVFIRLQHDYMARYSVGYERENVVYVPAPADSLSRASFVQELRRNPDILDHTFTYTPGRLGTSWGRDFEGQHVNFTIWHSDHNTLDFFGVDIIAGSGFTPGMTSRDQVIVNKKFMDEYGFTEEIIGKEISTYGEGIIVGVVEDVNFESLHNAVRPMAFVMMEAYEPNMKATIKIAGNDTPATLKYIEDTWNRFETRGRDFSLDFLDRALDAQYKRELNMSRLMGILGIIAVVIAVMGVYVLIMFNSRYKTKEIAICKVNGATIGGIALKLNRALLWSLLVAFVLALAPTLYFIDRWVGAFAYKASVPWWLYPGAGLLVLLISVATVSWQSYRAASANPVKALMTE